MEIGCTVIRNSHIIDVIIMLIMMMINNNTTNNNEVQHQ